jgi:metal-responsive CopG/Arc/MetJ family transcriptional regulator
MPAGRKPLLIPNVSWKIQVPIDIAAEIDLINLDPVRGTPAYGKRSEFVTRLLREALDLRRRKNGFT